MGSGSPPSKVSAIPSHMLNGNSPLHASTGPGTGTRARDARERESLNSSIRSSFAPRIPAEFDTPEEAEAALAGNDGNAGNPTAGNTSANENTPTPPSAMTLRYIPNPFTLEFQCILTVFIAADFL